MNLDENLQLPDGIDADVQRYCELHRAKIVAEYLKMPETDGGRIISEEIFQRLIVHLMKRDGLRKKDPGQAEREKLWERKQQEMLSALPEIDDTEFVLTWELEAAESWYSWVIKHGETVIHRQPAYFEDYGIFELAAKTLKKRYGNRVRDLVPNKEDGTGTFLYGDYLGSIGRVEAARSMLREKTVEGTAEEPSQKDFVRWEDVERCASRAFDVWTHGAEKEWARTTWGLLCAAGLANYDNEVEPYEVRLLFLALGGFYRDFCALACEERSEPVYSYWAEELNLDSFVLGQILGREPDLDSSEALNLLVNRARPRLATLLETVFDGNDLLLCSLCRTYDDDLSDDETLNDPTPDQMAAYEWLQQGAYPVLEAY